MKINLAKMKTSFLNANFQKELALNNKNFYTRGTEYYRSVFVKNFKLYFNVMLEI